MNRRAQLLILMLVVAVLPATTGVAQTPVQFELDEPVFYPVGHLPSGATRGDFNDDGHMDVAVSADASVSILLNDRAGVLTIEQTIQVPGTSGIEAGDVNGDGHLDLFIPDWSGDSIHLLLNDSFGRFTPLSPIPLTGVTSLVAFDLDGDGNTDVAATAERDDEVAILFGDGTGGFAESQTIPVGVGPLAVALGDVDGTPGLDVIVTTADGAIAILPGLGAGQYGEATSFPTGLSSHTLEVADIDGDGFTDLALLGFEPTGVSIAYGSEGGFEAVRSYPAPGFPNSVALSDVSGDGRVDIVAGAWEGGVSVLVNNGSRNLGPARGFVAGTGTEFVTTADIDGDGRLDVVATEDDDNNLMVLRNRGTGGNGSLLVAPAFVDLGFAPFDGPDTTGSTDRRIMVTNTGPDAVSIHDVTVEGFGGFAPLVDTCSGETVPPGHGCSIQVGLFVEGPGQVRNGTLVLRSSAATGDLAVRLYGEAGFDFPAEIVDVPGNASDFALQLSRRSTGLGDQSGAVVLARADIFADALAGSVLTSLGPLLFTGGEVLDSATGTEIERILPAGATVYLLGGPAALSADIESRLIEGGYTVRRLSGPTRVETAIAIAEEASQVLGLPEQVNLARADAPADNPTAAWADAVAVGGLAAETGQPVLLTPTEGLHPAVEEWLASRSDVDVRIIGGPQAVSNAVETTLAGLVRAVTRVAGSNRYATAVEIAQAWPESSGNVVAPGGSEDGWAFTLAVAALSSTYDMPILLTELDRVPSETCEALALRRSLQTPTARTAEAVRAAVVEGC
ncbi:FG-GAP-like repeat-containing protein [Euzebya tangerina]|uniref:FG-GAP-like repeat-containing protein n=1 Tax=Euzebya tangerina TaxID=591198 RepID=UPI000E31DEEB|nr:FG-GAP-like repeat-containing protein [Euzebya tangerina]